MIFVWRRFQLSYLINGTNRCFAASTSGRSVDVPRFISRRRSASHVNAVLVETMRKTYSGSERRRGARAQQIEQIDYLKDAKLHPKSEYSIQTARHTIRFRLRTHRNRLCRAINYECLSHSGIDLRRAEASGRAERMR